MRTTAIKEDLKRLDQRNYAIHQNRHGSIQLSEGCQKLREQFEANWLFDIIIRAQAEEYIKKYRIQLWFVEELKMKKGLIVFGTDGAKRLIFSEIVSFKTFPLKSIQLYLIDRVAMVLPMESERVPE